MRQVEAEALRANEGAGEGAGGRPWLAPCLALAAVLTAMAVAFRAEVSAAVRVWDASTAYNHCWLVLPVAGWLAWERRHRLAGIRPAPSPLLALLALPFAAAWLAAERLGIMEGRQLAALGMAEAATLGILGWAACRAMAGPLAYLVFLVPFGEFTVPVLQRITAWMIEVGLRLLGISAYVDELVIEIPAGTFYVAEACAGLRFIIASLAFGALYALTMFRSPLRRLVVMALAVTVPILANGLRALGIVVLGHYLGSAEAAAADHVVYGWVFFSGVILLLTLAGLPFREDGDRRVAADQPGPATDRTASGRAPSGALAAATAVAVLLSVLGPAVAAGLEGGGRTVPTRRAVELSAPEGCTAEEGGTVLHCGGYRVTVHALVFPARTTWAAVAAARRSAESAGDDAAAFRVAADGNWRAAWMGQRDDVPRATATAAWLDGMPASDGLRSRALQGLNSLGLGRGRPVVAVAELTDERGTSAPAQTSRQGSEVLDKVLRRQAAMIARLVGLSRDAG